MNSFFFDAAFVFYVVGLLASGIAFMFKQNWFFKLGIASVGIGFGLHTAYLLDIMIELGHFPMTDLKESLAFFAWTVSLCFLVSYTRYQIKALGLFLLPLVAVMMLGTTFMRSAPPTALKSYWIYFHTTFVFLAYGMFVITFIAGILYLFQEKELKSKKPKTFYYMLPSLELLDDLFFKFLVSGFSFMTVGLLAGVIWAEKDWVQNWESDPKVIATTITWMIYLILIYLRASVGWRGKRAAVINVVGFVSALFTLLGASYFGGFHKF